MENILITGGAGFIGSRLALTLARKNSASRIWVFDNLHPQVHGDDSAAPNFPSQVSFIHGDVCDAVALRHVVEAAQPAVVFHLAAETGTGQSYDEPARYCNANVIGTAHLIEAIRTTNATQRVVLTSSRAVYGEGPYLDASGHQYVGRPRDAAVMASGDFAVPLDKEAIAPTQATSSHANVPPAPASIYASTKLMQEYLLCQAGQGSDWTATVLRFQNVFGPGQSLKNPYTGVLSVFARQLLEGKRLAIFEDGKIARDFVFVDDVVDALIRAGERALPHGTILDIGSGIAVTIEHIARMLMRCLGRSEDSYAITGEFRIGDIRHAQADIRLARELLGWTPSTSLENGIGQLADWVQTQTETYAARL